MTAMYCGRCGTAAEEGAPFCGSCGTPMGATAAQPEAAFERVAGMPGRSSGPDPEPVPVVPAPPTDTPPTPGRRGRGLMIGAAVAAVAVAVGGTVVWWQTGSHAAAGGDSATPRQVLTVSDHPALKWQRTAAQLAPGLGCATTSVGSDDTSDTSNVCTVTAADTAGNLVVVAVSRGGTSNEVVGLDRATGAVKWQVASPSSLLSCTQRTVLWCVQAPVSTSDTSSDGSSDTSSGVPLAATVMVLDPSTGKRLGQGALPAGEATMLRADGESAYFAISPSASDGTSDSATTDTFVRVDRKAHPVWQKLVNVTTGPPGGETSGWAWSLGSATQVPVKDDRLYVPGVENNGKQLLLSTKDGSPVDAGPGHVVDVRRGTVISQQATAGLQVGSTLIAQSELADPWAYDGGDGLPLLASVPSASTPTGDATQPAQVTAVDMAHPSTPLFTITGAAPVAHCGGTLITASSASGSSTTIQGLDPKSGAIKWQQVLRTTPSSWWCSGDSAVTVADGRLQAYRAKDGSSAWSVVLPDSASAISQSLVQPSRGVLLSSSTGDSAMTTLSYVD